MELTLIAIAAFLIIGGLAALTSINPSWLSEESDKYEPIKNHNGKDFLRSRNNQFSLQKSLLIIGPTANHKACRIQRKLLKPAIPMLIREDISVIEIYGETSPRRNGEVLRWLDASLLRSALNAEDGFFIIYVDADGKTVFSKTSPMLTEMIADRAKLQITTPEQQASSVQSDIVRRLKAA